MSLKFSKGLRCLPGLFLLFFFFASQRANAQNCTVNAGVPESICPGQKMILKGKFTGLFYDNASASWSQVAGPAVTIGTPTISGSDINATVTGFAAGNTYTFRLSARCADGTQTYQDVVFTALVATKATIGSNIISCPGIVTLAGSAPNTTSGETGQWSIITRAYGDAFADRNLYNTTLTLPSDSSSVVGLTWTILNPNGCASAAAMSVTNYGSEPVNAGSDLTLSNCFNVTTAVRLSGSYAGNGLGGQIGTWSYVSGPSTPSFSNIHDNRAVVSNLVAGTYVIRWTVVGPCNNGVDELTITVPPPTQAVTIPPNLTDYMFCDGRTSTVLASTVPGYTNEICTWTKLTGNGDIESPNTASTVITNLTPLATSTFAYTIKNTVTNCSATGVYRLFFSPPTSVTATPTLTILPNTATSVSIPYTTTGGNQTFWQLVTGPMGTTFAPSGTTNYQAIDQSPINVLGIDKMGTYQFRILRTVQSAGVGGCYNAYGDMTVVISQPPTAANAGTTSAVNCNVFTATLAGNIPLVGTGYWSQVEGPNTATIVDIYDPGTTIQDLTNGSYIFRWIVTGGPGVDDVQSDVVVRVSDRNPTAASAGADRTVCNQTPITMEGNAVQKNEVGTWTVSPLAGVTFVDIHDPKTKVSGLAANTVYSFTWTIANACNSSLSTVIITTSNTAGPKAAVAGTGQCLSAAVTSFNLSGNAPTGTETGQWRLIDGPNSPSITSATNNTTSVTGTIPGTYRFEWSLTTPGCLANSDTVKITASAAATAATITVVTPVTLCGATQITLTGNTPTVGTGYWTQVGGPGGAVITDPGSPTTTVTGLTSNNYIFRWTISNGACSSNFADVKYIISAPPTTPTIGPDQALCGVTFTTLTGNPITKGTGLWKLLSGPNTPTFTNPASPTTTLTGLTYGTYKVVWTAVNGAYCGVAESSAMTITVTQNATASVASSGLCNATVAQLTGNSGSVGTWTFVSGSTIPVITTTSSFAAIASSMTNGVYTYRYTLPAVGACVATSATVSVTITASPSIADAGLDQTLCGATFTTLAGVVPAIGVGAWTIMDAPMSSTATFAQASSPTTTFNNAMPGVYLLGWNVTNGFCGTNRDIVRLTFSAIPTTADAGVSQFTACTGNITLLGNTPTVGLGTWSQVTGLPGTIDAVNSPATAVLGTAAPATYTFMWTISSGTCPVSTSTVTIATTSVPPVPADAGPNQSICNIATTATATLAGSSPVGMETGLWTIKTKPGGASPAFGDATSRSSTVSNLIAGTYEFTWTVSNGSCVSASTVTIVVTDAPTTANAGPDNSFCLYTPVHLAATAVTVGVGTWSTTSKPGGTPDPVFDDEHSNTTAVNGLLAGDYVFTWITTNGSACATSMSSVTIHIVQPPSLAQAGSFQTVCLGVNPVMAANSPTYGIGTWTVTSQPLSSPAVGFTSANSATTTVTGLVAGVYGFSWTISNGGCTSVDGMLVTVQPAIGSNTIAISQVICSGSTPAALTGAAANGGNGSSYTYQWQSSTTSASAGFADINGATTGSSYAPGSLTATTWYRRLTTSGACANAFTNTVEITVQPPLASNTITAPITATFCESGDPDVITGLTPTGGDGVTYNYRWEQSTTSASAGFTAITGVVSKDYDPGTITTSTWFRRAVSSGSCSVTSSAIKLTINPFPAFTSAQTAAAVCTGATFNYSPTANIAGTTFAWGRDAISTINGNMAASGAGAISQQLSNTSVVPVPVTYLYTLTAPTGCVSPIAYSVTVVVNPTPTVSTPSDIVICNGLSTTTVTFTGSPVANTTYNWTNSNPAIGLAASGSASVNAFTATNHTNAAITAVITITPVSNTCSGPTAAFTITVNPTAFVNTISNSVCSGLTFVITPANGTNGIVPTGTTYVWTAPTGAASADGVSGTGSAITGNLSHTSNTALTAVYFVTPNTAACGDGPTFSITISVAPMPVISPMSTTICAGVQFTVTPVNGTDGIVPAGSYSWGLPAGTGFSGGATGSNNPNNIRGTLTNTVSTATTATYNVVPKSTVGGCVGATFVVTVSILPKAIMSGQMTVTTCSGVAFDFTPTDGTGGNILPIGTTFTWPAPTGTFLTGAAAQPTATTHVFGTFSNTSNIARTATYSITPLSGACVGNTYTVVATINPVVNIASTTPQFTRIICSGTTFSVTPTNSTNGIVPAGTQYRWSAPTTTGTLLGVSASLNSSAITGTLTNPGSSAQTATYIVTPSTVACGDGAPFTVVVTVVPAASITPMSTTVCGGTSFSFSPADGVDGIVPSGTKYTWAGTPTGSGFSGGATGSLQSMISGTLLNTVNVMRTATYTVTPVTTYGCAGAPFTATVYINPTAQITPMTNVICNGSSFTSTPLNLVNKIVPAGTTYTWLAPTGTGFTLGMSGAGSVITGTLANSSSIAHIATYMVTPTSGSCTGADFSITVTVNPIAAVNEMTATTCSGVTFNSIPADVVNGTIPAGTIYSWYAPVAPGITGGAAQLSAIGSITGLLTNTTTTAAVAVYTITPSSNGCTGAQFTLTVTVDPSAQVTPMSTTICGGSPFTVTPANLTDGRVPPATTYSWLAVPGGTGFSGSMTATGAGSITGTLLNTVNTVTTATYLVTPLTGSCTGAVFSVTVYINPLVQVTSMTTVTCSGVAFSVTPTNLVNRIVPAGTLYRWDVSTVSGGVTGAISATGQTSISGTLLNPASTQQTVTYLVTPTTSACGDGAPFTVTVTVMPTASVTASLSATVCGGVSFTVTPQDGTDGNLPSGTKYSWLPPTGTGFNGGLSGTNVSSISGTLVNTTASVTTAYYAVTTLSGLCQGAAFTVTVTLNPKAIISQITSTICSGVAFAVTPVTAGNTIVPSGTNYTWVLATGSNLSGLAAASNQPDINGTLTNGVNVARTATYVITPTSLTGNCTGDVFSVVITVNPRANITAMTKITCSGVAFTVSPTNLTNGIVPAGISFTWPAPSLTGSLSGDASGSGALITGNLINSSNVAQTATYDVTPTTACGTGPAFSVAVTVYPAANVSPIATQTCSGVMFTVTPADGTNGVIPAGTRYTWSSPSVTGGITGGASTSTAAVSITGTLVNPTNTVQTATYNVTPVTSGCSGAQFSVIVTLNPVATSAAIGTTTCNGVAFTAVPVQGVNGAIIPSGTTYTWAYVTSTGINGGVSASGGNIIGTLINTTNITRTATYTVTPLSGSCTGANFTLTVNVSPSATIVALTTTVCSGAVFSITPSTANGTLPAGTVYSWSQVPTGTGFTGGSTGGPASNISGTLVNTTSAAVTATYIISTSSAGCVGETFTLVVTVNPTPTVNGVADQVVCNGTITTAVNFTGATTNTVYNWSNTTTSIGLAASGSGTINAFTATNATALPVKAVITVTPVSNTCSGSSISFSIVVNPTPTVNAITSQAICNGSSSTAVTFTGFVSNTTYNWTNTSAATGLIALSGTGNIPVFTGTNAGVVPITSLITVTPVSNTCAGTARTFTFVVNPTPVADQISSQIVCNGTATAAINFTGAVANTTYNWTNNTPSIGLAASNSGNIAAFTATNATNAPVTAIITVTPVSNTCSGAAMVFTITVNPTATLTSGLTPTAICAGTSFSYTATSAVAGATFAWSRVTVAGISSGGAGTGTGNINQTLISANSTQTNVGYVYTVTANGCTNPLTYTVTVPVTATPSLNALTATTCAGVAFTKMPSDITDGIVPSGTSYTWTAPVQTGVSGGVLQTTAMSPVGGTLVNTGSVVGTAVYTVTPISGACTGNTFTLTVTVNPKAIVNPLSATICSGASFNVTPADVTDGIVPASTTYSWNAPAATGISGALSGSGASSVSGTLTNSTSIARTITYTVTPLTNGCTGNVFTVTVTVDAKASINAMTAITSSNATFTVTPVDGTNGVVPAGTTYSWTLPSVTGAMTGGAAGTGSAISGTLTNPTNAVQTATYTVTPTSGNCAGASFTIVVTVNPVASVNALTVTTCSGVAFSITPIHPADGTIPSGTTYSWPAPSGTGFTGGASGSSGTNIGGNLVNTTTAPVTATYIVTPVSAGYTGATFTVTVTVNPTPVLSSTLTPADICSGTVFAYSATTATTGSVLSWSRTIISGITSGGAATGTGDISQTLVNSTVLPVTVNYAYTITANGCTNPSAGTVAVIVNPIPVLNSTLTPPDVYNATLLNYTATSLTPGTTFAWSRGSLAAINGGTTGAGVGALISETLTTSNPVLTAVVYAITLTANGCANAQTITVNVSPTPGLSSTLTPAPICSGTVFGYSATSATPSTTYTWSRAPIGTINGNTGGSASNGVISETLTNSSNVPVSVVYTLMLTANSFTSTQNVTVVVNPTPSVNTVTDIVACNNTLLTATSFSGTVAGTQYAWVNNNTAIGLASAGSGTINAFTTTNSGTSVITALITVTPISNTCAGPATTFSVTVNPTPVLSSTLTPTGICSGSPFSYVATSATAGTSFTWSRTTVTGVTAGGPATGTSDVTGQTLSNSTTAPLTVQYVYTLTANGCSNTQTVSLAVNPIPVLSSTLSPTAVFGGSTFTYTPTSATPSVVFTWARGTVTGISNVAGSGTGAVTESLINVTASPIDVAYTYTLSASGCANSQTVTISIIPSNIDAVDDDFSGTCVNGATGGTTASVLSNDILNSAVVTPSLVTMTVVADGGITGATFNASGQLVIPARTFEGTYSVTYRICVNANPGNCDQATIIVTVCRGLLISVTPTCINDVPYVFYKIEPNFIAGAVNPVTLTWVNGDHSPVAAQPVSYGIALEGKILWPGATVDSLGNGTDWPGWYLQNGVWIQGADGFEGTRPNAYLKISVNPTDSILFAYPPATPACNANPVSRPPVAVNDIDSSGQCLPVIINVLANDHDPEGGTLTVSLPSVTSAHGAGLAVNASGTVTYTPVVGFTGTDTFDYTITDPQGLTATATVTIKINERPNVIGGITGVCALAKDSSTIYSIAPVANTTNYLWTLPNGWTGNSTTNTIVVKAPSSGDGGVISVVPYNGGCAGTTANYTVAVIDYAKVTLTASPSTVKGDGVSTSEVTITLYDKNGNPIHCSGGIATLCTNYGTFSEVVDNGNGTYTGYLKSSANNPTVCGTVAGVPIQQTITTTFTGPQGSIKGNGPIFETETPLLTFNFTEGVGPFTVIYRPDGATKNDTLTNVVSNVAIPVKSISATQLYRMVSIIGSDNARRDNNFTRDTATILVVAPKIVITLTADNPKFLADNLYSTILRMKVKNIGNIDLASVQVRADLTDVFPNPVQFILDSVKQQGVKTLPNNGYDGIHNIDLFSWRFNSTPGARNYMNDVAAVQVPAMAYGNAGSYGASTDAVDGAGDRIEAPFLPGYGNNNNKENTAGNDGPMTTPFFFGALSKLDAGEESDMQLYVRIVPNGYYKPFVMQAVAVGTGHTEFGTALANSLSNDNGNEAVHPELTHNGDPLPTVINVFPNPVLGVAMNAGTPVLQGNGTYNVTLNYLLKNYGNVNLRNVNLYEELTRSIGSPATFNIVSAPVATGNLIANPSYNGTTDTSMLAANSTLGVGLDATVSVTINIAPNQLSALYRLFSIGTGFCSELGNTVTDISSNGTDPDPDGNQIPDEKLITLIPINMSVPPLVTGAIGIQETPTTTVLVKTFCGSSVVTVIPTSANTGGIDPYTYQWQTSADNVVFTNIAGATASIYTGTMTTNAYLRRIVVSGNQQGISNAVQVVIGSGTKPVITASGPLNLTVGGTITLTSSASSSYLWSTNATTNAITVSSIGSYAVTVTDANGCKATSDLVVINPPPALTMADVQKITSKTPVLQSDGTFLVDFTIRTSNLTSIQLDSVKIQDDLRAIFPVGVQFQVVGVKTSGKLLANELYNGNSQIELLADGSVLPARQKDSVVLSVRVTPNGFAGLLKNTAVQVAKTAQYGVFTVTSNDPLYGTGVITREPTQFVIPAVDIFIPSGFSPNRDGVNDLFVITRPFNTTISMEIYNRWGNLVYRDRNYNNDWGGKGNQPNNVLGEDLPDGTYYYIVLATDKTTGTVRKFAAYLTLKR